MRLRTALEAVSDFLDRHRIKDLQAALDDAEVSLDVDDLEFWEYHLEI